MQPCQCWGRAAARPAADCLPHLPPCLAPAGTTVLVCPHLLHRDPAWWGPDAAAFRPERWLELARQGEPGPPAGAMALLANMGPHGAFIPFGAGPRNCIGTGFAMLEAVLVLGAVARRFRLRPLPGAAFPAPVPQVTLRPDAVRLLLRRR